MQIIIVAGGGGTRLWPLSNSETPKQFARVIGEKSSIEHVFNYLVAKFPIENIWVNTNQKFASSVTKLFPDLPLSHILLEPQKRDNFAAVASQAAILSHHHGENEPLVFVTSDEFMQYQSSITKFQNAIEIIGDALSNDSFEVVTMGIRPKTANTNYGYLEIAPENRYKCYNQVVPIEKWCEKPAKKLAEQFLDQGNYIWNKFNPSFKFSTLKKFLAANDPVSLEILLKIEKNGVIEELDYEKLPKISIEHAFTENMKNVGVIALDINDWVDVGNWEVANDFLPDLCVNQNQIEIAGQNNKVKLINPDRKVAFVGVSDLLLVETEEGILIIDPKYSNKVKEAAEHFEHMDDD